MQNLKIRVNNEAEAEEVKRLAVKAGYKLDALFSRKWSAEFCYLVLCENMAAGFGNEIMADGDKPLSIGELREMANPMKEYLEKHTDGTYSLVLRGDLCKESDILIPEGAEAFGYTGIVHTFYKNDFRIFFNENTNGQWDERSETWIGRKEPVILWQREQDEPFLTPECTLNEHCSGTVKSYIDNFHVSSIERKIPEIYGTVRANPSFNDQYAEIEQVRQAIKVKSGSDSDHALDAMSFGLMGAGAASGGAKDNVNHPSHYTQGKVECIDALESATIGKSGIEAVCVANVIKYLWRYEEKNGVEDVKKAKFYLNRLLATLENNNG